MTNTIEDYIASNLERIEEVGAYPNYRPLRDAADEFIDWAANPQDRVYTGVTVLDDAMRGTAPGELTLIQGFSHSGKTLVATEMLINNEEIPIALFTPDETRPLVLTKLTAATSGVSAEDLEQRIQADDESARELLMATAERYGKLAVFDQEVTIGKMERMFQEVTQALGERPKAVVFDYADLLSGVDDVRQKISYLKFFGKEQHVAMFVLHQASRTAGAGGKKMSIDSGGYGGEQQSTHVIGVRRKKYMYLEQIGEFEQKIAQASNPNSIATYEDKIVDLRCEAEVHSSTITVSLVKNKRPPCRLVDDVDFKLEPSTGRLVYMPSRQVTQVASAGSAREVLRQVWEERELF